MILFPGRHLLTTCEQAEYLRQIRDRPESIAVRGNYRLRADETLVCALTSANQGEHGRSRYNPFRPSFRICALDRFLNDVWRPRDARIVTVPHYPRRNDFADKTIQHVSEELEGNVTPANTVVACSTPEVQELYARLGFSILPFPDETMSPVSLISRLVTGDATGISPASLGALRDFPSELKDLRRLWQDPVLGESGDLSEHRNYRVYAAGMGQNLEPKYAELKDGIREGVIADEGCADGGLLTLIARDFPDSDLYGVELSREFVEQCHERIRRGDFGGSFVHVHQRNLFQPVFPRASVDTTLCNSTTHELFSYGGGEESVRKYLRLKHEQLRNGGRLLIRDVLGPENPERTVHLQVPDRELLNHFARDFQPLHEDVSGSDIVVSARYAAEFLLHKDYLDNWQSEMRESFCHASESTWRGWLEEAGFDILRLKAYTSPWIRDNRWNGFLVDGQEPEFPTNIVIWAEKS